MTFAVYFGNRGFFPGELVASAIADINRVQVFSDAARTTFNIAGQVLLSLAFYEQWYLWILVNIASIVLWGSTMLSGAASSYTVVMFIKYCFYLLNSINGLRIWYRLSHPKEE